MHNEALPTPPSGYYVERVEPGTYAVLDSNYTRIGELWTYGQRTARFRNRPAAGMWYTSNTPDTYKTREAALEALIDARERGAA